jgi:hypothetical protein
MVQPNVNGLLSPISISYEFVAKAGPFLEFPGNVRCRLSRNSEDDRRGAYL